MWFTVATVFRIANLATTGTWLRSEHEKQINSIWLHYTKRISSNTSHLHTITQCPKQSASQSQDRDATIRCVALGCKVQMAFPLCDCLWYVLLPAANQHCNRRPWPGERPAGATNGNQDIQTYAFLFPSILPSFLLLPTASDMNQHGRAPPPGGRGGQ